MLTAQAAKTWTPSRLMVQAAETVFMTLAWRDTVKPIVEGYQRKILDEMKPMSRAYPEHGIESKLITDPAHSYLMEDANAQVYYARCNEERIKAGLKVDSEEHCPLLVADHAVITAENALIDIMEPVTGLGRDRVVIVEHRKELLNLTLRLLAPYCKTRRGCAHA